MLGVLELRRLELLRVEVGLRLRLVLHLNLRHHVGELRLAERDVGLVLTLGLVAVLRERVLGLVEGDLRVVELRRRLGGGRALRTHLVLRARVGELLSGESSGRRRRRRARSGPRRRGSCC